MTKSITTKPSQASIKKLSKLVEDSAKAEAPAVNSSGKPIGRVKKPEKQQEPTPIPLSDYSWLDPEVGGQLVIEYTPVDSDRLRYSGYFSLHDKGALKLAVEFFNAHRREVCRIAVNGLANPNAYVTVKADFNVNVGHTDYDLGLSSEIRLTSLPATHDSSRRNFRSATVPMPERYWRDLFDHMSDTGGKLFSFALVE